ncbi:DUF262 domain-containing protein [Flavobacteriaceae bacterium 14752]|uniref:DUF262 domain-containing protein n=1 Tax=Mesohalobacter salilacus TaxID=2491711 RepID=UPI000F638A44|nr:DUF262 domain-containing protein [Flavobacteriaceae bacterium 14752]
MSKKEVNKLKSIQSLGGLHFIVEDYQRGYKWGVQQIKELLEDINDFKIEFETFYCLQPLVVSGLGEDKYELIDGQQRLTTIYIILKCLKVDIYKISYKTRESSLEFLKKIDKLKIFENFDVNEHIEEKIKPKIDEAWKKHINKNFNDDNVDNYHFYTAFQFINKWLNQNKEKKESFKNKLLNDVCFIWHEPTISHKNKQSLEEIFINFNRGKIDLDQAELIKALFVLQLNGEQNIELKTFKLNQFAEEWDYIENQLQNNQFWFFLSNDTSNEKQSNRIDFLFDLINKKGKSNDKLFSYHRYLEKYSNKEILNWKEVRDLFYLLNEWYIDRTLFHLIGYIVSKNIYNIAEIKSQYDETDNKENFLRTLKKTILDEYFDGKLKEKYNIDSVNYLDNKEEIRSLLLLHNIINYETTDHIYRFPFDRFKKEKGWSLEHIHAQNVEDFTTIEEVNNWITDVKSLAENFKNEEKDDFGFSKTEGLISELEKLIEIKNDKVDTELKSKIKLIDEELSSFFGKHEIGNLCLLDLKTNISLGNKLFGSKRKELMLIDKMSIEEYNKKYRVDKKDLDMKPYIPLATKHAFLKYYTENTINLDMSLWGAKDRKEYRQHIENSINQYLQTNDK